MKRRDFLKAAPVAFAPFAANAMPYQVGVKDVPFLAPVTNWPDEQVAALCYPVNGLHDYRYLLHDGHVVRIDPTFPK